MLGSLVPGVTTLSAAPGHALYGRPIASENSENRVEGDGARSRIVIGLLHALQPGRICATSWLWHFPRCGCPDWLGDRHGFGAEGAALRKEDCEPDPIAWYTRILGEPPDYSKLLGMLAKTPAERSQVLKDYFEPTDEEREQGIKTPTAAQKAIASLAAGGYVRVIMTTNFDRLLERSLEDAGVIPTVISSPDSAEGAMPLSHVRCCVI